MIEFAGSAAQPEAKPPLTCGYCGTAKWNDESVTWLPLAGDYRRPYCADTCARYVMTDRKDTPVVLPVIFEHFSELAAELRDAKREVRRLTAALDHVRKAAE